MCASLADSVPPVRPLNPPLYSCREDLPQPNLARHRTFTHSFSRRVALLAASHRRLAFCPGFQLSRGLKGAGTAVWGQRGGFDVFGP